MLPFWGQQVVCIACGAKLTRDGAREYDRFGDRFDRRDKRFEYLCASCDAGLCHHPRTGVEERLCGIEESVTSQQELLRAFLAGHETVDGQKD